LCLLCFYKAYSISNLKIKGWFCSQWLFQKLPNFYVKLAGLGSGFRVRFMVYVLGLRVRFRVGFKV